MSGEVLRFGVVFADGRTTTNLDDPTPLPHDAKAVRLVLTLRGGGGGSDRIDAMYWLAPLPPAGPLEFV